MTDEIETVQLIADLKANPDRMPIDPGCEAIKYLSVEKGVQGILRIDGSASLLYLVNPNDGREPYIVIRGPKPDLLMTTKLHRESQSEDENDD